MNADRNRDRLLEEALKHELGAGLVASPTAACLDAETLAAWTDGGLDAQAAAMAESHVSSCARCQAMAGRLAGAIPATADGESRSAGLWRWWLAPLAASAAAVLVWMVVPEQRQPVDVVVPESPVAVAPPPALSEPAPAPAAPLGQRQATLGKDQAKNDAPKEARANESSAESKRRAKTRDRAEKQEVAQETLAARTADAQAVPPPTAPAPAAVGAVAAPEAGVRQLRKQAEAVPNAQVTARSSPSPTVIWFVGRGGMVMLTTDGRTFTRVPFPEQVDLTAVTATDDRIAVVTTVDARLFRTDDAGKTWRRQ